MNIEVIRYSHQREDTLSLILIDGKFFCYGLEDEYRAVKVKGETRIPDGTYKVGFLKEDTPLTLKYRDRYPWFTYHLEVKNVPGFSYIYIHIGNKEADTAGCLLVGNEVNSNIDGYGFLKNSRVTFEKLYKKVSQQLALNKEITITYKSI